MYGNLHKPFKQGKHMRNPAKFSQVTQSCNYKPETFGLLSKSLLKNNFLISQGLSYNYSPRLENNYEQLKIDTKSIKGPKGPS